MGRSFRRWFPSNSRVAIVVETRHGPRWTWLVLCLLGPGSRPACGDNPPPTLPPAEVKASFLKMLDRPKVPLDVQGGEVGRDGRFVTERRSFASETKADGSVERVP